MPYEVRLTAMEDMIANQNPDPVTAEELRGLMSDVIVAVNRVQFYIGDEQIARHVNLGNQKLDRRYNPIAQGALSYASAFSESLIDGAKVRVDEIQNHSVMFEKRFQNGAYNRSMYNALVKGKCKVPAKASPKYTPDQRLEIARSRRLEIEKGNIKTNGGNVSKTEFVYGKNVSRFTKVMKGANVIGIGFQAITSGHNIWRAIDTNDERKGRIIGKSAVDVIVPIVCIAIGGPGAWIIGGTYFIVDIAGGWDYLMDQTYNTFNEK